MTVEERLRAENDVRTSLLQAVSGVALTVGVVITFWQITQTQRATQQQLKQSQDQQISDRFTAAIGQLGDRNVDVRVGGIHALDRIAWESEDYRDSVAEVLAAYVRGHAAIPRNKDGELVRLPAATIQMEGRLPDVQTALTAASKRASAGVSLRLAETDLRGANLNGAHLDGAYLARANLADGSLIRADLGNAELPRRYLTMRG